MGFKPGVTCQPSQPSSAPSSCSWAASQHRSPPPSTTRNRSSRRDRPASPRRRASHSRGTSPIRRRHRVPSAPTTTATRAVACSCRCTCHSSTGRTRIAAGPTGAPSAGRVQLQVAPTPNGPWRAAYTSSITTGTATDGHAANVAKHAINWRVIQGHAWYRIQDRAIWYRSDGSRLATRTRFVHWYAARTGAVAVARGIARRLEHRCEPRRAASGLSEPARPLTALRLVDRRSSSPPPVESRQPQRAQPGKATWSRPRPGAPLAVV